MKVSTRCALDEAAADWGSPVPCAGNLPVALDDPEFAWFVESGAVDLFLVERRDDVEQAAPQHLLRAAAGRLLPGVAPQDDATTLLLVAKGLPNTILRRIPAARLAAIQSAELAEQVDTWLLDFSAMLSRDVTQRPQPDALLESGSSSAERSGTLAARRDVVWLTDLPRGAGRFMDLIDPADSAPETPAAETLLPLTPASWLTLAQQQQLSTAASAALADQGRLLPALHAFNHMAFTLERLNRQLAVVDQVNLERARASNRRSDEETGRRSLFDLYGLPDADAAEAAETRNSALHDVLQAIGRYTGIDFRRPAESGPATVADILARVLGASGVRARRVRLAREDHWWVGDSGAMLALRSADGQPVALLPGVWGNYREFDPVTRRTRRVTARSAAALGPEAWLFYPPLTATRARPRDLLRIAREGLATDVARILVTGLLGGLVMLLPALALGFVADEVIPAGEVGLLLGVSVALAAFGLVRALLQVLQGMALMRLEGRVTSRMEAAFWDRLLRLPAGSLKRYPAGDLALRGMTFQNLRDALRGAVGNGLLAVIFLSPALLLIAYHDARLGALAAGFSLLSLLATAALALRQVAPQRRRLGAVQRVAGGLAQLIGGISKLRVDSAESSAFAVWARDYRQQKQAEIEIDALESHVRGLGAALPFIAGAALLLATTLTGGAIAVGDFIVIYVLFTLYQAAVVRLGAACSVLATAAPGLDQVRPLLAEAPETGAEAESGTVLDGEIAFDRVSFRYDADGPLILDSVSLRARPGEFVAIAGTSGAGKSTVFRLALGLEQPSGGSVYYDGRDLRHLNLKEVRRQIGVVPQVVQLHPQDLWDNIVGDHEDVTAEDAWRAAQLAAVDSDIAAMPMGMLTPVGAGTAVTSGGETQRIRIAHALIGHPRLLLLDEATNWLDNDTQSQVMENLAQLPATRIVIAHRLSTLRQADRIYVLEAGKVVQAGTFSELQAAPGAFQDLVRRQTAD